jgi:hypothetical protein
VEKARLIGKRSWLKLLCHCKFQLILAIKTFKDPTIEEVFHVGGQCKKRQHKFTIVKPRIIRLSIVRILSQVAVHVKDAMHGGALTFQTLFQGNKHGFPIYEVL